MSYILEKFIGIKVAHLLFIFHPGTLGLISIFSFDIDLFATDS